MYHIVYFIGGYILPHLGSFYILFHQAMVFRTHFFSFPFNTTDKRNMRSFVTVHHPWDPIHLNSFSVYFLCSSDCAISIISLILFYNLKFLRTSYMNTIFTSSQVFLCPPLFLKSTPLFSCSFYFFAEVYFYHC